MIVIDGTNLLLGRLATYVSKRALEGEKVIIVNSENIIISGKKEMIFSRYKDRRARGGPMKGPYFPRGADRIMRRTIRGMLPAASTRGREAFRRIMCYLGVPEKYKDQKLETVKSADFSRLKTINYTTLGKLAKFLGSK